MVTSSDPFETPSQVPAAPAAPAAPQQDAPAPVGHPTPVTAAAPAGLPAQQPYAQQPYVQHSVGYGIPPSGHLPNSPVPTSALASLGARFGAFLLEFVLFIVTLGIGWFIWSMVMWTRGTTPAKKLLGLSVVDIQTGRPCTWGHMLVRSLCQSVFNFVPFGALVDIFSIFSEYHLRFSDRWAKTAVVKA